MGGKTRTTTSIDPAVLAKQMAVFDRAQGLADQPFAPYSADRIAPFNADQLAGYGALRDIANGGVGSGLFGDASAAARSATAYQPQNVAAQTLHAGRLGDLDLSGYMNPYVTAVVDASNADVERSRQLQRVRDAGSATSAGAFGGARHGVADALTNEATLREAASRSATLRQQGYSSAQHFGSEDLNRALSADQANQSAALQAAQGNQTADLQGAQLRLSGASLLGSLSGQEYQQAVARAGLLGAIGDAQQAQMQKGLDFSWDEFARRQQDPYAKQALLASALAAIQAPSTTTAKTRPGALDYADSLAKLIAGATGNNGIRGLR